MLRDRSLGLSTTLEFFYINCKFRWQVKAKGGEKKRGQGEGDGNGGALEEEEENKKKMRMREERRKAFNSKTAKEEK